MLALLPQDNVIFSEEAHFHLRSRCINTENENNKPQGTLLETSAPRQGYSIVCPFKKCYHRAFFFRKLPSCFGQSRYMTMMQDCSLAKLDKFELEDAWFQKDEVIAHTERIVVNILKTRFPGRLISLIGDLNCTLNPKFTMTALSPWKPSRTISGLISQKLLLKCFKECMKTSEKATIVYRGS